MTTLQQSYIGLRLLARLNLELLINTGVLATALLSAAYVVSLIL